MTVITATWWLAMRAKCGVMPPNLAVNTDAPRAALCAGRRQRGGLANTERTLQNIFMMSAYHTDQLRWNLRGILPPTFRFGKLRKLGVRTGEACG